MKGLVKVVVIGTGGHSKVVAETILMDGRFELSGFANSEADISEFLGFPVFRSVTDFNEAHFIVAVGNNAVRARLFAEHVKDGLVAVSAIHPKAIVSPSAIVGEGTVVAAGAIINPFAQIGRNCIINTGAVVEHDCVIGDHTHLAPGTKLAGNVKIAEGSFLGIGTTVIPGIKFGENCQTGAGAVVIRDVEPSTIVVGVPAKPLRRD